MSDSIGKKVEVPVEGIGHLTLAGFWVRFAAFWIDGLIVWAVVMAAVLGAGTVGVYVPIEMSILIVGVLYWSVLTGWRGQTAGKALCGIRVLSSSGSHAGFLRAVLRECVGKPISAPVLLLGFIWVAFSKCKRAWHDFVAGTVVRQDPGVCKRRRAVTAVTVALVSVAGAATILSVWLPYNDGMRMAVEPGIVSPYSQRDPATLVEVSSLEPEDRADFVEWLDANAKDPVDFAVEAAAKHTITIFEEVHHVQDNLVFLSRIIPDLYHRAGVTCVAVEYMAAENNARIARLVNANEYDRALALSIARNHSWQSWGGREYWDVLETVWRLNNSLPEDQPKMRLVGIDRKFDLPAFALMGVGDDGLSGPAWEKLRAVRVIKDFPLIMKRDEIMARNVEKQIVETGERGIVWVGVGHAYTRFRQPAVVNGKVTREWARLGFMLRQKYDDRVFKIRLHNSSWDSGGITEFVEQIATQRDNAPFGFGVDGSPFENLRDETSRYFRALPGLCFSDIATGYVFLKPISDQSHTPWLDGYISERMFLRHKPYFEAECGRKLKDANEANRILSRKIPFVKE
jgi:uncharacterized RDD family membrane protein YckC